jgi:ParB family chromosome partitioning protein
MSEQKQTTVAVDTPKNQPPRMKALRADLEKRKKALEADGWTFDFDPEKDEWTAAKPGEIGGANFHSLEKLLGFIEKQLAKKEEKSAAIPSADTLVEIETSRIAPSPLPPQQRRRSHFKPEETEELGNSILQQGLISPIVVRPVPVLSETKAEYEIVVGERRWLAHILKNLATIKCFVRHLADETALEIQMQENLQRKDVDPLDEAFSYKYYLEHSNHTVADLAARFAKSEKFIRQRLKLNDLIPEAIAEIEAGTLPLGHALVLARYPAESQKIIVEEQYAYKWQDKDDGAATLAEFKDEIEENIVRRLAHAPFNTEDARLRVDGLICPKCPQRTGFEPLLFTDDFDAEDRCLNQSCFKLKTNVHLRLERIAIAEKMPNPNNLPPEEMEKKVPLVTEKGWVDEMPFKGKPLTNQKLYEKPECEYSQLSLSVHGERKGQPVYICKGGDCKVHNPLPGDEAKTTETAPDWKLRQFESDFQRKVGNRVRLAVFSQAAEWFDDYRIFWQFDDLVKLLIAVFLEKIKYSADDILFIIRDWKDAPKSFKSGDDIKNFVESLDKRRQSQLLFLLAYQNDLYGTYNAPNESALIEKIAADYTKLDCKLLDAETRLELAPKEFKEIAALYLTDVQNGQDAEIPRFWWKESDDETDVD